MAKLSTQEMIDAIKELTVLELNDLVSVKKSSAYLQRQAL